VTNPRTIAERIGSPRDAASTLFNLPGYRVIAVGEVGSAGWWVDLEIEGEHRCSGCGVSGVRGAFSEVTANPRYPDRGCGDGDLAQGPMVLRREEDVLRGHRAGPGLRPLHRAAARRPGRGGDLLGVGSQRGRRRVLGVVVARADHPDRGCGADERRRHDGGAPHRDRRAPLPPGPLLPGFPPGRGAVTGRGCPRSSIWTPAGSSASSRVAATPG